jgi:DNA-binding transcriptional ArsR family regulator
MTEPIDDVLRLTTPAQLKGLAHPMRERLMMHLTEKPTTISQLARALNVGKGSVSYHLNVMHEAGVVKVGRRRTVRGGTEQYYQIAARRIEYPGPTPATAGLGAVAAEIEAAAAVPVLVERSMSLTTGQAERLAAALNDLVHNVETADDGQPRYGMVVALFRYADRDHDQPGGG